MERSFQPTRTIVRLSDAIQQHLNSYALVAAAAGVSVLAMTEPAHAKIVYTQTNLKFGPDGKLAFDLNHDGTNDFELEFFTSQSGGTYGFAQLTVTPGSGNAAWERTSRGRDFAVALHDRVRIGPKGKFSSKQLTLALVFNGTSSAYDSFLGPWVGQPGHRTVKDRYLGLKFVIKGKTHFGWARLKVHSAGYPQGITGTLSGFAYETVPNKSIGAGITQGPKDNEPSSVSSIAPTRQPVTLGLLALGSPALSVWRREE